MLRALEHPRLRHRRAASSSSSARGFTVLTGETGAGKSILVDALELLVGGTRRRRAGARGRRARRAVGGIRCSKQRSAVAAGSPSTTSPAIPAAASCAGASTAAGRSRCFVNGHAATLAQLREAGEFLVDIHGQHEHQSLLRAGGAARAARRACRRARTLAQRDARRRAAPGSGWQAVAAEAEKQFAQREAERAELQETVAELKKLAPARRRMGRASPPSTQRLAHGSSLLDGAQSALEALAEAEGACLPQLAAVASRLRALSAHDAQLKAIVEMLESAEAQAGEAARDLRHYASRVDLDPQALREAEARIEALHAAARKYRVEPEELPALARPSCEQRLAELELAATRRRCSAKWRRRTARYDAEAKKLSAKRRKAAREALGKAVTAAMQTLAMAGGRFAVALQRAGRAAAQRARRRSSSRSPRTPACRRGRWRKSPRAASCRASASRSSWSPRRSRRSARWCSTRSTPASAARWPRSSARSLKQLGSERQVLCVTHLPQVAAQRQRAVAGRRSRRRGKVRAASASSIATARIEEIARMLGGAEITRRRASTPRRCSDARAWTPRGRLRRCGQFVLVQSAYSASEWPCSSKPRWRATSVCRFSISAS